MANVEDDDDRDVEQLRERHRKVEAVLAGALPPTLSRLSGYPPYAGNEADDRRLFVQSLLVKDRASLSDTTRALLELAAADASIDTLRATQEMLLTLNNEGAAHRFQLYAALAGDAESAHLLGAHLVGFRQWVFSVDAFHRVALGLGLLKVDPGEDCTVGELLKSGLAEAQILGKWAALLSATEGALTRKPSEESEGDPPPSPIELAILGSPGQASKDTGAPPSAPKPDGPSMVVVPPYSVSDKLRASAARDVSKAFEGIAGVALPLVELGDPGKVRRMVEPRFPHLAAELDIVLRQRLPWRVLFVGDPGGGKTELARRLLSAVGLPFLVYGSAGSSDGAFGGTSAQWATARASVPLQLVNRNRIANPAIILDELDKTSRDSRNGALVDVLLNFLEPASASRVMDLALELEVDVSRVSFIGTANSIENVPVALRDRFKIVRIPSPGLEHFETFVATILDEVASQRGIDRRWIDALAQDEADLVRRAWKGGSLRRLRRLLEVVVDGRDRLLRRD